MEDDNKNYKLSEDGKDITLTDEAKRYKLEKAFEIALDTRKFEIELYWKRTKYFWDIFVTTGGSSVILSLYSHVQGGESFDPFLFALLITIEWIGLVSAVAWKFANIGSKYWQVNWEEYIDKIEREFSGHIFRHPISNGKGVPKRYSVSKINEVLTCFFICIWGIAIVGSLYWGCSHYGKKICECNCDYILSIIVIGLVSLLSVIFIVILFLRYNSKHNVSTVNPEIKAFYEDL